MSQVRGLFFKVPGESLWVNLAHLHGLGVRPQMRPDGHSAGSLEERHEATGRFEVMVFLADQVMVIQEVESRADGEHFILELLSSLPAS